MYPEVTALRLRATVRTLLVGLPSYTVERAEIATLEAFAGKLDELLAAARERMGAA